MAGLIPEISNSSISIGPETGQLSEVIKCIVLGQTDAIIGRGYEKCIELIEQGKLIRDKTRTIQEGHIICMVRSFLHVKVPFMKQSGKWVLMTIPANFLGRLDVKKRGQEERDFAYMHFCVYVGKSDDGKHYVAENAGADPNTGKGCVQLTEISKSFDDVKGDDSAFFVIRPKNDRRKTQQHALATIGLEYKYHGYYFNCEAYAGICAGFYDEDVASMDPEGLGSVLLQRGISEETVNSLVKAKLTGFQFMKLPKDRLRKLLGEILTEVENSTEVVDRLLDIPDSIRTGEEYKHAKTLLKTDEPKILKMYDTSENLAEYYISAPGFIDPSHSLRVFSPEDKLKPEQLANLEKNRKELFTKYLEQMMAIFATDKKYIDSHMFKLKGSRVVKEIK